VSTEENNRHKLGYRLVFRSSLFVVRVRRWCKRPPADGWSSGCVIWRLQVHVYRRL